MAEQHRLNAQMAEKRKTKKKKKEKVRHPVVECEGCGEAMDMNDVSLQDEVMTFSVLCINETFFFHDEICVNLRKYKEIIRKYVSEEKLRPNERSKNVPSYIKNLLQNFNNLIGVRGNEALPRPVGTRTGAQRHKLGFLSSQFSSRKGRESKSSSKLLEEVADGDQNHQNHQNQQESEELSLIRQQREIACVVMNREREREQQQDEEREAAAEHEDLDDIPLEIEYCDTSVYGVSLWEFVMQQLLTKQMKSLWLLLAYFSMEVPTVKAIELLQTHIADIAKVKDMENLELVCSAVIENSHFPIATALHLSHFMGKVAEDDLSRKDEFLDIARRYTVVAEKLVESVESDHLLSIYLEAPTDLNMMSVFEIAINYEMSDFFDNNRVDRIMGHMWSQFDFLNPNLNFRTKDIDLYEVVHFLFYHPAKFYFSPVGRYYIQSVMYVAYVALITVVCEQQAYLYTKANFLEVLMWICNGGYGLFEVMEMTFRGIEYFSDSTNYFDMCIMLIWSILGVIRLGTDTHDTDESLSERDARNTNSTAIYMTLFGVQIIILYCRIAIIFVRSKQLGPFIRMIGGMVDDIINFTFVEMIFFLGFTFALRYIVATDIGGDDADCEEGEVGLSNYYEVAVYVFITLMGQQEWSAVDPNGCISPTRSVIAMVFIMVFSVLGCVLLLNLLIAMMATTYETKLEVKSKEVNFARTQEI